MRIRIQKSNQPILRRICILILNTKSMCSKALKQKAYPLHSNRIWCTVCRSYCVPKFRFDGFFSHQNQHTHPQNKRMHTLHSLLSRHRQWQQSAVCLVSLSFEIYIALSQCIIKHLNENRDASFWVVLCENINARNGKRQLILKVPMQCMLYVCVQKSFHVTCSDR